jgi:glucose/arabinose dehydrogenase
LGWPLDLTVADDGTLYIADGTHFFQLLPGGRLRTAGMMFSPGYPGNVRGVTAVGPGEFIVTNTNGQVSRYRPERMENEVLAEGLDSQLYGVAVAPDGAVVVAAFGSGRVLAVRSGQVEELATSLREPTGIAFVDGVCLVAETGGGRVVRLKGSRAEAVVDGLERPQGILVRDRILYIVDAGAKALIAFDLKHKTRTTIASDLPIGAPHGVTPKPLRGMPPFSGPQGPFAGIAAGPDGRLYVSADGEGSVLALQRAKG